MFLKTLLACVVLVGVAVVLLAVKLLVKKGGKFPDLHIGGNNEMAKRGITCATSQDRDARQSKTTQATGSDGDNGLPGC